MDARARKLIGAEAEVFVDFNEMTSYSRFNFRRMVQRDGCPATLALMAGTVVMFLLLSLGARSFVDSWLVFNSSSWLTRPWTLISGSLLTQDPLYLLFGVAWLFVIGGSLERSLGTWTFLVLWGLVSVATGVGLILGWFATGIATVLLLMVTLNGITVAWAMLNRRQTILIMFVLPVQGFMLAAICGVFTVVEYGLPLGLFALSGAVAAWSFVALRENRRRYRGVIKIPAQRSGDRERGVIGKWRSRKETRRVEELFRKSGMNDNEIH